MKRLLPILLFIAPFIHAQPFGDPLVAGFKNPPEAAKPRTWWHWTMSNVSKEGITKDLEWMKRSGIGGFMLADVNFGGGQSIDPKTPYGTPQWFEAVLHAAKEAERLGLEMGIFSSPGWSETGGPWVKPEQAMKKLVWSETQLMGPRLFEARLPEPPTNNGQIRNTGATYYAGSGGDPTNYADSAVIAFRTPADEGHEAPVLPRVRTHTGPAEGSALLDDQLNTVMTIPAPENGSPAWVQYEYPTPFTARAFTIGGRGGSGRGIPVGRLLASDDGVIFHTLVTLPGSQLYRQGMVRTFAFSPVTARFFRIEMTGAPLGPANTMSQEPSLPAKEYALSEAILHSSAKVHRWEEKAGFSFLFEYDTVPTPEPSPESRIGSNETIDLSSHMKPDGTLSWQVPEGRWTILRLGYSLTGAKNRPATPEGSGFEADKLSREHMQAYCEGYFGPLKQALGPLFGRTLRTVMMDSWEAGTNNWSDRILEDFKERRGYDPKPWLPVLTGRIVGNAELSDRFTWDFRRTLADLWAENHYGTVTEYLSKHGISVCAEAAGVSLEMPEDTLLNKSKVAIPAGEFWVRDLHPRLMYLQDVRGAASAAHVYGKPLVAAEAFTGGGYEAPLTLKTVGDYWLSQGVNRLIFHTSAHQPADSKPGNAMVGTHLHRNITWAEQAAPYFNTLARQCHMLQQGLFVADIAYLLNEGAPSTPPIWGAGTVPTPPEGYDYDFINADVLLNRLSVAEDGRLVLPDGMSYRVLVLPETTRMRPELLRKLKSLVQGGAIISGRRPLSSPSLKGYPKADEEVRTLAQEIWGDLDGVSRTIRTVGKGKVYWGWPLSEVLSKEGIVRDFDYARELDSELAWLHRRTKEADIYYVANLAKNPAAFQARFRSEGREAEVWYPDTGDIRPAGYRIEGNRTTVPMKLAAHEAVFVVFRRPAKEAFRASAPDGEERVLAALEDGWELSFPEGLGAPPRIEMPKLIPWTSHAEEGVRFFSGTATYTKTIQLGKECFDPDHALFLDLGKVGDLAELWVNEHSLGVLWKPPFRADVSAALREGPNQIRVRVTNQWTNRLIGDQGLPEDKRILSSKTLPPARHGDGRKPNLPESGLLGPVLLLSKQVDRVSDSPDATIAGFPVNYTEAKAGRVPPPDPLVFSNGKSVTQAREWFEQRRPEILAMLEQQQFGRRPETVEPLVVEVTETGTPAFDGKALRKQLTLGFKADGTGPKLELLVYLPAQAKGPVPVLLNISFMPNNLTVNDPGVKPGTRWDAKAGKRVPAAEGPRFGSLRVVETLERGFGLATFCYTDVDPDAPGALAHGIRAHYLRPGQTEPADDEWGSVSAWAWAISRVVDYFETDASVDSKRIAITGMSRLGKTVLWAGARDPRIALVIASVSGEGGAALSRRHYGETIGHLVSGTRFSYQFARNYARWAEKPAEAPFDANLLVSLIAPRPLLLQTGDTDIWSDPKGEFLSLLSARPVYELLGKKGPNTDAFPPPGQLVGDTLAYYMHDGGHGPVPSDWPVFLSFLEKHLK